MQKSRWAAAFNRNASRLSSSRSWRAWRPLSPRTYINTYRLNTFPGTKGKIVGNSEQVKSTVGSREKHLILLSNPKHPSQIRRVRGSSSAHFVASCGSVSVVEGELEKPFYEKITPNITKKDHYCGIFWIMSKPSTRLTWHFFYKSWNCKRINWIWPNIPRKWFKGPVRGKNAFNSVF